LEAYEKNTLYIIVDFKEGYSVFGDTFPLILGGEEEEEEVNPSHFGDQFPIILDGDNNTGESSHFGDPFPIILDGEHINYVKSRFGDAFPLTFGNVSYYIGSRFPIKFKQ